MSNPGSTSLLMGRFQRLIIRSELKREDFLRNFDWFILGGHRFFPQYYKELSSIFKWVFIVGCNNSGTSLLQRVLERSGKVSTLPMEGQRYTTVLPRAYKRGYERVWTEYAHELTLNPDDAESLSPRLLHDWLRDLKRPILPIIVEKTPANIVRMEFLQNCFPNSYFLGLVRNGYAVVEGIRRKGNKPVDRGARHWAEANRILVENSSKMNRYHEVRYEDLSEDPVKCAKGLAEFLEIDAQCFEAIAVQSFQFNTVNGKGEQAIRNFNQHSITKLSSEDIKIIRENAGRWLDYFGYETP